MYGGRRGGGKSYLLRWWLVQVLLELHKKGIPKPHVFLGCESYPVLADRQISKINIEMPRWLGEVKKTQSDGLAFVLRDEFGGGVMVLRNLDDPSKYLGAEYAAIGIDQIEKVSKEVFDILRGNLRYPGVSQTKFLCTANPGGKGHQWVKRLWIDRDFPDELKPLADKFAFVEAAAQDNPHLDEQYWEDLRTLPERLRKAWLEGDWEIFSGQAFPGFGDDHIIKGNLAIPINAIKIVGIDSGYTKPFAAVWVSRDPDIGRYTVYKEIKRARLSDSQQARYVQEITALDKVHVRYGDPSMWHTKSDEKKGLTSTADNFADEGVYLTRADNNRISGKRKIDRLLMNLPDMKPGLQVHESCKGLIAELQYLVLDERKVEDVDTDQDDHLYDALRYALSSARGKFQDDNVALRRSPWEKVMTI
jgi:hypothetical protein